MRLKRETLVDFSGFDIATNKTRVFSLATPIYLKNSLQGYLILESDLNTTIEELILPEGIDFN